MNDDRRPKTIEWHVRKYHKLPWFQHLFWSLMKWWKEKCILIGSLTAWLLNRSRNVWTLQHYRNVKGQLFLTRIVAIGFELLNECRRSSSPWLKTLWRAYSKVKQMMIFEELSEQIEYHMEQAFFFFFFFMSMHTYT